MLRPSGAICGSEAHCKSNTSMGLSTGFTAFAAGAALAADSPVAAHTALAARSSTPAAVTARLHPRLSGALGDPAIALMFIDDPYGLHECVTNCGTDEAKAAALQILAHRLAQGRGAGNPAQV